MRDPNNPCLFCNTNNKEYIFENDLAFVKQKKLLRSIIIVCRLALYEKTFSNKFLFILEVF